MQFPQDKQELAVWAATAAVATAVAVYFHHRWRAQQGLAMRPVRLLGAPLLGHTLQLQRSKGLVAALRQLSAEHGDFVVTVGGFRFMCLSQPVDFAMIWRDSTEFFSFEHFGDVFASRVNGEPREVVTAVTSRVDKVKSYAAIRGDNLINTSRQIQRGFYVAIDRLGLRHAGSSSSSGSSGSAVGEVRDGYLHGELQAIVGPIFLFCAIAGQVRALTSQPFTEDVRVLYKNINQFAREAILIGMGLPAVFFPRFHAARDFFGAFLGRYINPDDDAFFRERVVEWNREKGYDTAAAVAADISTWIGVLGNNLPTFVWIVLFLHHPTNAAWRARVLAEVDALHLSEHDDDFLSLDKDSYAKMPVTTAFLNEVIRVVTKASSIRLVMQDCDRTMPSSGETYHFTKGDFIFMNGFVTMNESPELGPRTVFNPEHFLSPSSSAAAATSAAAGAPPANDLAVTGRGAAGSGLTYSEKLFLFGGGKSLCPGRFLVVMQHKAVLAHFLHNFEMELLRPTPHPIDAVDYDFGGATTTPCDDIPVRLRWRQH